MRNPDLDPRRFEFRGGSTGILLLHGYTAATPEMRPLGEFLASKGMTVVAPLLPGHGTSAEDLNTRSWREIADAAANEFYQLQSTCDQVFVGGLSMGGLLALHLGQRCSGVAGIIPMAAALYMRDPLRHLLPILKHLLKTTTKSSDVHTSIQDPASAPLIWSYDHNPVQFAAQLVHLMHHVRDRLESIEAPLLIFHAAHDKSVPAKAAHVIAERVSSTDVEIVLLSNSGHCLSIDGEREQVCRKTWQWIQQRVSA